MADSMPVHNHGVSSSGVTLVSKCEATQMLGVSPKTAFTMQKEDRLKALKADAADRYDIDDLHVDSLRSPINRNSIWFVNEHYRDVLRYQYSIMRIFMSHYPPRVNSPPERLINVRETATRLGLSVRTIWKLVSTGKLAPPLKIGAARRWRETDITAYIERLSEARSERSTSPMAHL